MTKYLHIYFFNYNQHIIIFTYGEQDNNYHGTHTRLTFHSFLHSTTTLTNLLNLGYIPSITNLRDFLKSSWKFK